MKDARMGWAPLARSLQEPSWPVWLGLRLGMTKRALAELDAIYQECQEELGPDPFETGDHAPDFARMPWLEKPAERAKFKVGDRVRLLGAVMGLPAGTECLVYNVSERGISMTIPAHPGDRLYTEYLDAYERVA